MRNANPRPSRGREAGASSQRLHLTDVIPLLDGVRRSGNGYVARCPMHDDEHPSLSIAESPSGEILLKCFAGCDTAEILRWLRERAGLDRQRASRRGNTPETPSAEQERPESRPEGLSLEQYATSKRLDPARLREWGCYDTRWNGRPAVAMEYRDEQGSLIATRYRLAMEGANRFRWERGNRPSLYGLWRLPEWDTDYLLLVEGESDVHCCWTAGLPALGIPGAGVWQPEWWEKVSRFAKVYIMPDSDAAGEQLLQRLAESCPETLRERVQVIRLPEGCKDCSELWLQTEADPQRFLQALRACERVPLAEWCEAESEEERTPLLVPLRELITRHSPELEHIDFLGIQNLLARGTATLLSASPKAGKSTAIAFAARNWIRAGLKVAILTEEPLLVWKLRAEKLPELREVALSESTLATSERWVEELERFQPDVAVVDTLRVFGGVQDEADPAEVGRALAPFVELTRRNPRMVLLLCHHLRKSADLREPLLADVAGAHAFTGAVDQILLLTPSETNRFHRILHPIASRFWHDREPLVLALDESRYEYRCIGLASEVLPEQKYAQKREQVRMAIATLGRATAEEVHALLQEQGERSTLRWIRDTLSALHAEGRLQREGTGRRGDPFVYSLPEEEVLDCGIEEGTINNAVPQFLNSGGVEGGELRNWGTPLYNAVPQFLNPMGSEGGELRNCGTLLLTESSSIPQSESAVPSRSESCDDPDFLSFVESAVQPDDPFALEPHEVALLRELWRKAQQRGFPELYLQQYSYAIHRGRRAWLQALPDIAAPSVAQQVLRALDAGADAPAPIHSVAPDGNASGAFPSSYGGLFPST